MIRIFPGHCLGVVAETANEILLRLTSPWCVDTDRQPRQEMNESPRPVRFSGFGPPDLVEFDGEFCPDCMMPELDCRCQRGDA